MAIVGLGTFIFGSYLNLLYKFNYLKTQGVELH